MWILENRAENSFAEFTEGQVLSFGSHEACDIISKDFTKPVSLQVRGCLGIIFVEAESRIRTELGDFFFRCAGSDYRIYSDKDGSEFFNAELSEEEIMEVFSSDFYLQTLIQIQNLSGSSVRDTSILRTSAEFRIVREAATILNRTFWNTHDFGSQVHCRKFARILWAVWAQSCRYGILTKFILNREISEIMASSEKQIFVEINGVILKSKLEFKNAAEMTNLMEGIVGKSGRRLDESFPYCDARLEDGSRVHAIIPPLAVNGPCLTIRKFPKTPLTSESLVSGRSCDERTLKFLSAIVKGRKNILVSGGTSSGKTTLLNILSSFIPASERIVTIEDCAELQLQQPHVIRLEARQASVEGRGEITLRDLVRNALRMRPDRVLIGECRGGEAFDMLQAMNTGHEGSLTSLHANSATGALRRLETLCLFANSDLPATAIREQIVTAIDFIVHQNRDETGQRRIFSISKMCELNQKTGFFETETLMEFDGNRWKWA